MNTAPEARPPEPLDHAVLQEFSTMRMHVEQVRAIVLDAVTKLGDGFERISSQSLNQQGLLEKTLHSVDDPNAEAGTFARFVEQSQTLNDSILRSLERTSSRVVALAERLESTLPILVDLDKLSRAVRNSAEQIRFLALNASIEASRAGTAGSGFAVVASSVKELAMQFGNVSTQMDSNVDSIRNAVGDVASEAKTAAIDDRHLVGEAREATAVLRSNVGLLNRELGEQLRDAQNIGTSIQQGINLCVRGLQFGDLVAQLSQLNDARIEFLAPVLQLALEVASKSDTERELISELAGQLERHRQNDRASAVQQTSMEVGDVELF